MVAPWLLNKSLIALTTICMFLLFPPATTKDLPLAFHKSFAAFCSCVLKPDLATLTEDTPAF